MVTRNRKAWHVVAHHFSIDISRPDIKSRKMKVIHWELQYISVANTLLSSPKALLAAPKDNSKLFFADHITANVFFSVRCFDTALGLTGMISMLLLRDNDKFSTIVTERSKD